MSTANVFRVAQRRLSKSTASNPFAGKSFYVNPSYRRCEGPFFGGVAFVARTGKPNYRLQIALHKSSFEFVVN